MPSSGPGLSVGVLAGLLALLHGCGERRADPPPSEAADGSAVEVVDAAGRTVRLAEPPRRIVSLVPSASETLMALGAGDRLVGRTDFDTARAMAHLPSVGGGLQPNLERLVELDPGLVIRFAGESDPGTADRLSELGIPHLAVRPDRIGDAFDLARKLGRITGREAAADSLVARLEAALEDVRRRVAGRPRVRTVYLLGGTPPWVAGPGTFIDQLIEMGGGENAFPELDALYRSVSPEELLDRRIEVALAAEDARVDEDLLGGAPLRRVSGVVQRPGPRLGEAAREIARALHPDAFP